MYDHTSQLQMKQVTHIINQSKLSVEQHGCDLGKNSDEDNSYVKMNHQSAAQSTSATQSSVGTHLNFSGTFSNCTINVCLK